MNKIKNETHTEEKNSIELIKKWSNKIIYGKETF